MGYSTTEEQQAKQQESNNGFGESAPSENYGNAERTHSQSIRPQAPQLRPVRIWSNAAGSSSVERFQKTYDAVAAEHGELNYKLIKFNADALAVGISDEVGYMALVFPGQVTFWHLLAFESNKHPVKALPADRREYGSYGVDQYDYIATAQHITSRMILDPMESWLLNNIKGCQELQPCGFTVVPAEAKLDDPMVVTTYIRSAVAACLDVAGQCEYITDAELRRAKGEIVGNLTMEPRNNVKHATASNMPVRSDIRGKIGERREVVDQNILIGGNSGMVYAELSAYIDALPAKPYDPRSNSPEDWACYRPEIVITEVDLSKDVDLAPLARFGLALTLIPYINTDNRWMLQFQDAHQKGRPTDVGGFGYGVGFKRGPIDANQHIDISNDDVRDNALFMDFMAQVFKQDNAAVSYRFTAGDVYSSITRILVDISNDVRGAQDSFLAELDNLFDPTVRDYVSFSQIWRNEFGNSRIVLESLDMPYGYYTDSRGLRPIADIDTLAVLNYYKNQRPERFKEWCMCTMSAQSPYRYSERISRVREIYQEITQGTFIHTGSETKLFLNPEFMVAWYRYVQQSALKLRTELAGDARYVQSTPDYVTDRGMANNLARGDDRRYQSGSRNYSGYGNNRY